MYVLRRNCCYVTGHNIDGFIIGKDLDKAAMFHSMAELLQFVSKYQPKHGCGTYEIVRIREIQQPRYIEDRTVT